MNTALKEEGLNNAAGLPDPPQQVAVLGAGSWGTALAILLAANGHEIRLWARSAALAHALQGERENRAYLPGATLLPSILPVSDLSEAVTGADVMVFAVPSGAVRETAAQVSPFLKSLKRNLKKNLNKTQETLLISAAKGLEEGTGLRMSQTLAQAFQSAPERIVALSGPNLAVEVARGIPSASVAACADIEAAKRAQRLFSRQATPTFRVYTSRDVVGVELGGAVKNVIAIGAGVCDGLGFGDNSKAALMTRGLTEAVRLGVTQGANAETFRGLSGLGDLMATGASRLSRNYRVGFGLGQGRALADILSDLGQVAEGVPTTRVLCELAARNRVEMPLCQALDSVLFAGRNAPDVIRALMLRPPKEENETL